MSSGASAGQLIGALGAFFAAGGVCFYATNVANVFGGATTMRRCDDDEDATTLDGDAKWCATCVLTRACARRCVAWNGE